MIEREDLPEKGLQRLVIEMDELFLRGDDWDVLAQRFPEMGELVEQLRAQGSMHMRFHGSRPFEAAPYRYDIEGRPVEVKVTPRTT